MAQPDRKLNAGLVAIGLGLMVVSGGFLYADFRAREGAWADLKFLMQEPSPENRAVILRAWSEDRASLAAIITGAPGVALLAFGGIRLLTERRAPQHGDGT